jgi:hypothetical protein
MNCKNANDDNYQLQRTLFWRWPGLASETDLLPSASSPPFLLNPHPCGFALRSVRFFGPQKSFNSAQTIVPNL